MKAIVGSVFAFIIIATGATTFQAAAKSRVTVRQAQAEPCIGLSCIPPNPPTKHRTAFRRSGDKNWGARARPKS